MQRSALTPRDEGTYRQDVTEEQSAFAKAAARPDRSPDSNRPRGGGRTQAGRSAGRMQWNFHNGRLPGATPASPWKRASTQSVWGEFVARAGPWRPGLVHQTSETGTHPR